VDQIGEEQPREVDATNLLLDQSQTEPQYMFSREGTAGGGAYLPVELGGGVELLPGEYLREAGGMGVLLRAGAEAPRDGKAGGVEVMEIPPPCRGGKTRRRDGIGRNCGVCGVGPRREGRGGGAEAGG
jgi:hypothetical protein